MYKGKQQWINFNISAKEYAYYLKQRDYPDLMSVSEDSPGGATDTHRSQLLEAHKTVPYCIIHADVIPQNNL